MRTVSANPTMPLTFADVVELAEQHGVPAEDALLISVNLYGIASEHQRHRARVHLRLHGASHVPWMVIVPLNATASPFQLVGDELLLGGEPIADVERIDADEAVGGYFRDEGRAATLNPNARSRCTGCAFCPNTLEASADPRLAEERGLRELLSALAEQHPRGDLSELREVTVSTGCFEREDLALGHLAALRSALTEQGVRARIGLLTSVLRSRQAFEELGRTTAPFVLRLTVECFTRRDLLLKASKTELDRARMPEVLRLAKEVGHDTSFTYIVGLDDLASLEEGVAALVPHTTEFPNFQIYQAHNTIMSGLRVPGAGELEFYLRARRTIETIMGPSGLRPVAWECYRPLWYFAFDGEPLVEV